MAKNATLSYSVLSYGLFVLSSMLILVLAIVNDGSANDDHLEVCDLIFQTGQIPEPKACWQCYHPKLYHYGVAKIWAIFHIQRVGLQTLVAQLINAFAGIITLFFCLRFINQQHFRSSVKLFVFSLIALNPRFITTSVQPSNDSLIILFGTLIIYTLYKLILNPSVNRHMLLIGLVILAGLTKGSALTVVIGVVVVFILKMIVARNYSLSLKKGYLGALILLFMIPTPIVGYFGEYYGNYKKYDIPVVMNMPTYPMPDLFEKTTYSRPGGRSIAEGYFTFPLVDMIENPVTTNDLPVQPQHRTSVWSQLYGRTHFIYFDNWPEGIWQKCEKSILSAGRIALALALIPSIIFLMGIFLNMSLWKDFLLKRDIAILNKNTDWVFHVFLFGFIGFIILYTAAGRDYSFAKIIYLFPGILASIIPLLVGFEYVHEKLLKNPVNFGIFSAFMFTLLAYYLIPVVYLITELASLSGPF